MTTNPSGEPLHCMKPHSCASPYCLCVTEKAWQATHMVAGEAIPEGAQVGVDSEGKARVHFDPDLLNPQLTAELREAVGQTIESIQLVRHADVVEEISFELSGGRFLVVTGVALFGENVELSVEWR